METELVKYLLKHTTLPDEVIKEVVETSVIKSFEKRTILLKEGEIPDKCYLVLKGCIRCYLLRDGEENTVEFYTEEQPVSPFNLIKGVPSEHYLECIEDTVVCISTSEHESKMFEKFPELESACRIVGEAMMSNYQTSFANYKTASAEERYLSLLRERPDLIQRVPQYMLASYLGIKPESLSRIRKRLNKK